MRKFFSNADVQNSLASYIKSLGRVGVNNGFEEKRNNNLAEMLKSMTYAPEIFDSKAQINIGFIADSFLKKLNEQNFDDDGVDIVYAYAFRFFIEEYISDGGEDPSDYFIVRQFTVDNISGFSESARNQIEYALKDMSISMFKRIYNSEDLSTLRDFISTKRDAERLKDEWDKEINDKKERVESLQGILDKQKNAFNFVGLYAGFSSLSDAKEKQLMWARLILILLALSVPSVIFYESKYFLSGIIDFSGVSGFTKALPMFSIVILLVYYFRIALSNYNSIRAQIMQIELRKSLCQFIQSYAEYSKEIRLKDGSLLDKFEDVIFTNIMVSEEKIPSTFDGLEQVVKLLNAVKGQGK